MTPRDESRRTRWRAKDVPTAVHAEDFVVDHDRERQEVEHVREVCPHVRRAVLPHALRVEAVRLRFRRVSVCRARDDAPWMNAPA